MTILFVLQEDGNLVLKRNDEVCWASGTYGIHPTPCSLVMQENGELAGELFVTQWVLLSQVMMGGQPLQMQQLCTQSKAGSNIRRPVTTTYRLLMMLMGSLCCLPASAVDMRCM